MALAILKKVKERLCRKPKDEMPEEMKKQLDEAVEEVIETLLKIVQEGNDGTSPKEDGQ